MKVKSQLDKLLKEFTKDLTIATQKLLIKKGVEADSDLVKNLEYKYDGDIFQLIANDYYIYVSTGRRSGGKKIPIVDLISWIKEKGINYTGSINSLAFRIQNAIYKNGIKGKKYQDPVVEVSIDMISEYTAEELSQIIVDDLVEVLESSN